MQLGALMMRSVEPALALDLAVKVAGVGVRPDPDRSPGRIAFRREGDGRPRGAVPGDDPAHPGQSGLLAGRPLPYPLWADIAFGLPFALDAGAKRALRLFAIPGFDVIPHALGWFLLSIAFGLAVAPLV